MKLFRKQIKITKKCRHVTVKKTDDRTTTGTLMRRPKPEVLALARSEISISLVHRLSLATGAGCMGFRKVCQSEPSLLTSKKRKKTKFATSFYVTPKTTSGNSFEEAGLFLSNSGTFASALQALRWVRHLDHLHKPKSLVVPPSHFKVIFSVHANLQLVLVFFLNFCAISNKFTLWKYHSLMRNCKRTNFTKSFQSWRLEVKSSWP